MALSAGAEWPQDCAEWDTSVKPAFNLYVLVQPCRLVQRKVVVSVPGTNTSSK